MASCQERAQLRAGVSDQCCQPRALRCIASQPILFLSLCCRPQDAVYLLAGDSGNAGHRFNDVWCLSSSSSSDGSSDGSCQWQQLSQGSCTARSNAAAAVTQDWLFLFGGLDSSGVYRIYIHCVGGQNACIWGVRLSR
jgi:hypothetical protein